LFLQLSLFIEFWSFSYWWNSWFLPSTHKKKSDYTNRCCCLFYYITTRIGLWKTYYTKLTSFQNDSATAHCMGDAQLQEKKSRYMKKTCGSSWCGQASSSKASPVFRARRAHDTILNTKYPTVLTCWGQEASRQTQGSDGWMWSEKAAIFLRFGITLQEANQQTSTQDVLESYCVPAAWARSLVGVAEALGQVKLGWNGVNSNIVF